MDKRPDLASSLTRQAYDVISKLFRQVQWRIFDPALYSYSLQARPSSSSSNINQQHPSRSLREHLQAAIIEPLIRLQLRNSTEWLQQLQLLLDPSQAFTRLLKGTQHQLVKLASASESMTMGQPTYRVLGRLSGIQCSISVSAIIIGGVILLHLIAAFLAWHIWDLGLREHVVEPRKVVEISMMQEQEHRPAAANQAIRRKGQLQLEVGDDRDYDCTKLSTACPESNS
jgi:hypothetical protein